MTHDQAVPLRLMASLPPLASDAIPAASGVSRRFANARLNSRSPYTFRTGTVALTMELPDGLQPCYALGSAGRVFIGGLSSWAFYADGQMAGTGASTGEDAELHLAPAVVYAADGRGQLAAIPFDGGAVPVALLRGYGDFQRTFLHRHGDTLVAAGQCRVVNPHTKIAARIATLETLRLHSPDAVEYGRLVSVASRGFAEFAFDPLCVAMHGEIIVAAREGEIAYFDLDLVARRRFTAQFQPLGVSLADGGRICLLVDADGRAQLWTVAVNGEFTATMLPADFRPFQRPPLIGLDHRVYLLGATGLLAFAADGALLWRHAAPGPMVGAAITAEDRVLLASGSDWLLLGKEGGATAAASFPGEALRGDPLLCADGQAVAVTERRVHWLHE